MYISTLKPLTINKDKLIMAKNIIHRKPKIAIAANHAPSGGEWVAVFGYEGDYEVNSCGGVRSLKRNKIRNLKQGVRPDKYLVVTLCKHGVTKTYRVHRLVAEVFTTNPKDKPCVNHMDGNRQNNNVTNLEWVTASENHCHAYRDLKKESHFKGRLGKEHHKSKGFSIQDISGIIRNYGSGLEFTRMTGKNSA